MLREVSGQNRSELAVREELQTMERLLAQTHDLEQVLNIQKQSDALVTLARKAQLAFGLQHQAARVRLCAERKAGEALKAAKWQRGGRKSPSAKHSRLPEVTVSLREIGVTKRHSTQWQKESSVPQSNFVNYLDQCEKDRREATSKGLLRIAKQLKDRKDVGRRDEFPELARVKAIVEAAVEQRLMFCCIYVEPPWPEIDRRGRRKGRGATAFANALAEVPLHKLACRQAHIHLYTASPYVEQAMRVLRRWRHPYCAFLAAPARDDRFGPCWREDHDLVLTGVRGDLAFRDSGISNYFSGQDLFGSSHVLDVLERVSPGPRLDLFGRTARSEWAVLANAVRHNGVFVEPPATR